MSSLINYQLYLHTPEFEGANEGISFVDLAKDNGFTMLTSGPFTWLPNIRPWYHVSYQGTECLIELYTASCFTHQLEYDQLYVRNAKPN